MKTVNQESNPNAGIGISLSLRNITRRMPALDDSRQESTESGSSSHSLGKHSLEKSSSEKTSFEKKGLEIVTDVNLQVQSGETCAVVGASGSGKTTLLGIMAGMDAPDGGEVVLRGQDNEELNLYKLSEEQRAKIRARDMGFVFQNFQLVADMHALDNVLLSLELSSHARGAKRTRASVKALASEWLTKVGLGERQYHFPRQLSGGEQQRVALARAFACQPGILFADEPTGSLDENTAEEMMELLFFLNRDTGSTMILVTHDQSLAARCDSVYRLERHRLNALSLERDSLESAAISAQPKAS